MSPTVLITLPSSGDGRRAGPGPGVHALPDYGADLLVQRASQPPPPPDPDICEAVGSSAPATIAETAAGTAKACTTCGGCVPPSGRTRDEGAR